MPFAASFTTTQGTDCTIATLTDTTDYTDQDIPAQRNQYIDIIPGSASGKNRVLVHFVCEEESVDVVVPVTILGSDTQVQVSGKIITAMDATPVVQAVVSGTLAGNYARFTSDNEDVLFEITCDIEVSTDLSFTTTTYPFSTRIFTVTFSDQSVETIPMPYGSGTGNTVNITDLDMDEALNIIMTITPQVEVDGSTYTYEAVPVLICNFMTCYNTSVANMIPTVCTLQCSSEVLIGLSSMSELITASQARASVGDQNGAQLLLNQANNLCTNSCGC